MEEILNKILKKAELNKEEGIGESKKRKELMVSK